MHEEKGQVPILKKVIEGEMKQRRTNKYLKKQKPKTLYLI